VDPALEAPHGPHKIQQVGTVTVPRDLMREVGLERGQSVHWLLNPDIPGTLVMVPTTMMGRVTGDIVDRLRHAGK
jgi:hypothetical protein